MDFNVIHRGSRLGILSIVTCLNAQQAHPNVFGGIPCAMEFFENQMPDFKYPIAVLKNIEMDNRRKGDGTMTMKQFHHWAKVRGIPFGILTVGIEGDDYESELKWKINFYQRVGWNRLKTPNYENLINPKKFDAAPTNDWMYCDFKKCLSNNFYIKFTPQTNCYQNVIKKAPDCN
jgi:hypothetical protein